MLVSTKCFHIVEKDWKFCRNCGSELEGSVEEAEVLKDLDAEGTRLVEFRVSSGTYRASYIDGKRVAFKELD